MVFHKKTVSLVALFLLLLVISSNYVLYHSSFGIQSLPADLNGVVVGSILDLSLVAPLLFLAWQRKFSVKYFIVLMATGLIAARFIIPSEYLASFQSVMWLGVGIEGVLIFFELSLLFMLAKNVPPILKRVKSSSLPLLFSFSRAINEKFPKQTFIHILCSEMLMFYYAFGTWKKQPSTEGDTFTLYKRSSFITFQIMIIHAIVIETLGLHWLLHNTSIVLSVVLLFLNIYSIVFFIGDIQALRLNPLRVDNDRLYVSFGLAKRMEIRFQDIEEIIEDTHILEQKIPSTTIEFIARDFETVHPDLLLTLKSPIEATLFMGIKKKYKQVAIRVDDPHAFKKIVKERLETAQKGLI
ncbi:beta-carotene 15,15'-monooxygenase [Priestia megaterium]|uniref:beta-carotene 15,15'-monooxygenase n=1 Tax=Priestia megaterium TaxID=1404 RepID=UPI001128DED8|nr:beta-carotene 15,15'-monooxygenase [Priestia megaterium]TPF16938.1 beta-carotene 15,15'-monooxygenase [Priestia megaterium]TPF24086.1 beta-carotene 15,15'-monooxygenase [Priestia megaterium]